jgi:lactoylglutathione lyase
VLCKHEVAGSIPAGSMVKSMATFRESFPILQVADMRRSVGFYSDLLGFGRTYSFPSDDDPEFVLLAIEDGKLGLAAADGPVETGSTAIWAYTDDVDAAVSEFREAGFRIVAEPADRPWGERVASIADPDGYMVHIGAPAG